MRCRCCGARSPGPSPTGPTGRPWRRWPGCCQPRCASPARHARHATGLAPSPDHPQVDVSEPGRPSENQPGDPRPGAAAGAGEPRLGIPQGAWRAAPTRSPGQRGDRAADPAVPVSPAGLPPSGHLLAGVPGLPVQVHSPRLFGPTPPSSVPWARDSTTIRYRPGRSTTMVSATGESLEGPLKLTVTVTAASPGASRRLLAADGGGG